MRISRTGSHTTKAAIFAGITALGLALTACGGNTTPQTPSQPSSSGSSSAAPTTSGSASGAPSRDENADLVIWADQLRAEALRPFADQFGADNGLNVQVQFVNDVRKDFSAASQSGTGPDVIVGAHDWLGEFYQNGAVAPLNMGADMEAKFSPIAMKAATFAGQTFAVPYAIETLALVRNTELVPDAPKTLEDAIEEGQKLVKDKKATNTLLLEVGQAGNAFMAYPFLSAFGGGMFAKNADGDFDATKPIVNSAETVKGAELLEWLGKEKVLSVNVDGDNATSLFTEGDVPFFITGPWAIPAIRDAGIKYEITPLPATKDGGQMRPFATVNQFYVSKNAKNPAVAEEFVLNVVGSLEVQKALYDVGQRVPALTEAADALAADNPELTIWADASTKADMMPNIPQMNAVWGPVGQATADIIKGSLSAKDGMDAAQKNIEQALAKG
ncbi:MAG: maltose ABC transporter substrate-binding protein [Arachnia sp.]